MTSSESSPKVHANRTIGALSCRDPNLPFDEWTATFGEERLTGALLDRLTHHVHILEMNGPSYRLAQSRSRKRLD